MYKVYLCLNKNTSSLLLFVFLLFLFLMQVFMTINQRCYIAHVQRLSIRVDGLGLEHCTGEGNQLEKLESVKAA